MKEELPEDLSSSLWGSGDELDKQAGEQLSVKESHVRVEDMPKKEHHNRFQEHQKYHGDKPIKLRHPNEAKLVCQDKDNHRHNSHRDSYPQYGNKP